MSPAAENKMVPGESLVLTPVTATYARRSRSAPLTHNQKQPEDDWYFEEKRPETPIITTDGGRVLLPRPFFGSQIGDSVSSTVPPKEFSKLLSTIETCKDF